MLLWSFGQVRAKMYRPDMRTSSIFNTQHLATPCNRVAKRVQHVAPNNVAICCVQMLQMLGPQCWDMMSVKRGLGVGVSFLYIFFSLSFVFFAFFQPNSDFSQLAPAVYRYNIFGY